MQLIIEKRVSFSLKLKLVKNVIQESIWIWIGGNTAIKDGLLRFTTVQNFYRSFEFDGFVISRFLHFLGLCTFKLHLK